MGSYEFSESFIKGSLLGVSYGFWGCQRAFRVYCMRLYTAPEFFIYGVSFCTTKGFKAFGVRLFMGLEVEGLV